MTVMAFQAIPLWPLLALIAALGTAGMMLTSEFAKIRALHLMVWLRAITLVLILPGLFLFAWPAEPLFYGLVIVTAFIFCYCDLYCFGLAAKNSAGVVTRIEPLSVLSLFFLWTAITPALTLEYLQTPLRSLLILIAIGGAVFFAFKLRKCPISLETLKYMMVPVIMAAIGIACAKTAIDIVPPPEGVYCYMVVQSSVMLVLYSIIMINPALVKTVNDFAQESRFWTRRAFVAGFFAALFHILHMGAKYYGFAAVENPAYISMIGLSAPVIILFFYALSGREDQAAVWPGLGILACAALLVYATAIMH